MADSHDYNKLSWRISAVIVLVSLTPLFLVSLVTAYQFHTAYRAKVLAHLEELVLKHEQNIDGFLHEKLADIRVLSSSCSFPQLRDPVYLENLLTTLQEQHSGVYVDLGLINDRGEQVAYAGPFRLGQARYAESPWFQEAMQRQYYISDVFLGLRGLPHFIVAVKRTWQGREWIVRSSIDFVAFNRLVEKTRIGETGLAYIINRKGEFQTSPRIDLSGQVPMIMELIERHKESIFPPEGHPHQQGTGFVRDPYLNILPEGSKPATRVATQVTDPPGDRGETVYVFSSLKNGDWVFVYQQAARDAFRDLYRTRHAALALLVLGSLAIIITEVLLSKRIVNQVKRVDEEKQIMNEQVIEAGKMASLGELAAGIAHEINNPVAVMVEEAGWVDDLLQDAPFTDLKDEEDYQEIVRALKQIKTQGARCKEITHKLLSFARKTDPTLKKVQLNAMVEEMAALSEQKARYGNVKIRLDLEPGLPKIRASQSEMQQVLLNLINNAVDAMEEKGGEIALTTRSRDGQVLLSIADTGHGIPKANLQRIFEPFYTTKAVGKGTGLGLSICYGIIKNLGGDITVTSAVGAGTTFTITLPAAGSEDAVQALAGQGDQPNPGGEQ
jgi:two-component system NtrC family sensor kinase